MVGQPDASADHEGPNQENASQGGGSYSSSAEMLAAAAARHGEEVAGRLRGFLALHRHPRPLTVGENGILREAIAPVLHDLEATSQTMPDIREERSPITRRW
jgi:hypothetical protein